MATHKSRKHRHLSLERGQVIVSLRTLAKRWRWHMSSVRRFISELKVNTALSTVSETPEGTIYRVVNYDTYAVGEKLSETPNDTPASTAPTQEQEVKKKKKTSTPAVRVKKWRTCPADWSPSEAHRAFAQENHLDLAKQEGKFRRHYFEKPRISADDTFTTWLENAAEWAANGNGNGKHRTGAPRTASDGRTLL